MSRGALFLLFLVLGSFVKNNQPPRKRVPLIVWATKDLVLLPFADASAAQVDDLVANARVAATEEVAGWL